MRKLVWSSPVSLDGFVEGPHGLDWVFADAELHDHATAELRSAGAMLFGRVTYQLLVDFWPTAAANPANPQYMIDFANAINDARLQKFVFSKTLDRVDWNARLIRDIVPEEIKKMKQQPGKDLVVAGATIGSELAQLGLIDDYELLVHPIVLGSGVPMFKGIQKRIDLKLTKTQTFQSGVVVVRYQAAQSN